MSFSKKVQDFIQKNNQQNRPIHVFLKSLSKEKHKFGQLVHILQTDKAWQNENIIEIEKSFETREEFLNWYYTYLDYYTLWFRNFWEKASIEQCIGLLPCITPWAFEAKSITKEIGSIPSDFSSKEVFLSLVDKLLESQAVLNFRRIKDLEVCNPEALLSSKQKTKKRNVDHLAEKTKVVKKLLKQEMEHDFTVEINTIKFRIKPLFNPLSNKIVFRLQTPNRHKYILKVSPDNTRQIQSDALRKAHENQLIRADSPYSNALMDFYLKFNKCPMAADIQYYNFIYDVALYRENNTTVYRFPNKKHTYKNLVEFNKKIIPEISRWGIYLNDVRDANFLQLKKTNTVQLIDTGHATYANPLNPGLPGYTMTIGNLSGREAITHFGALYIWKE